MALTTRHPDRARTAQAHVIGAWAVLVALTALSWWLGTDHGVSDEHAKLATCAVILVAFAKVWVVGHSFMELRHAMSTLRLAFAGWIAITSVLVLVIYLVN